MLARQKLNDWVEQPGRSSEKLASRLGLNGARRLRAWRADTIPTGPRIVLLELATSIDFSEPPRVVPDTEVVRAEDWYDDDDKEKEVLCTVRGQVQAAQRLEAEARIDGIAQQIEARFRVLVEAGQDAVPPEVLDAARQIADSVRVVQASVPTEARDAADRALASIAASRAPLGESPKR